jgi:putative membrane protein
MKLPELKKIFRKKYIIRVVAGALVVGLVSTGTVQYTARADKAEAAEETTNSIIDTDNLKVESKDLDRDETVYLITKPDGTVTDTISAVHLINKDGEDTIDDVSDLTDIKNMNGDEKFTQDGDKVTWEANGNDIYYQGHSTAEAPVTVKVTYTLDGDEISPKELAGKSGHVKIHYDYTNNTSYTEKVNGEDVTTVVPFAAITGMILNDDFTNVKVSNGRVIQNGTKTIAIGYALPGVKDSLEKSGGSFDKDLSLPESFDVEADVKDFDLETQMTALIDASNTLTSNAKETDDLSSDMDKLSDATDELADGSKQLSDGAGKLGDGAKKLADGAKSAKDGSTKLESGSKQIRDGLGTLQKNMSTFTSGASSLSSGLKTYTAGVSQLNGGIGQLKTSLAPLSSALPALGNLNITDLATQMSALSKGVAQLKTGSDQLLAGYNGDGTAANPGLVKSMDQLTTGSKSVSDAAAQVSSGASSLDKGIGQIQSVLSGVGSQFATQSQTQLTQTIDSKLNGNEQLIGLLRQMQILGSDEKITLSNIDTVVTKLTGAQTQIITALTKVNGGDAAKATATYYTALDGLHQVQAAKSALDAAGQSLQSELTSESVTSQIKQLTDGSKQLADGSSKLAAGAKTVSDGMSAANEGVKKMAAGQKQLSDGINQLSTSVGSADLNGIDTSSISNLSTQFSALIKGVDQLYDGSSKLVANNDKLTGGAKQLSTGAGQISTGVGKLYTGAGSLYTGVGSLSDGLGTLYDGTVSLSDGAAKLSDGADDLHDGIVKFNKEGIEKLINSYNGDIKPLANQLRAAIDAGENYQSFSGIADGKKGAVKFLYRMDAITAPDDEN